MPFHHLTNGSKYKVLVACDEPTCTNVKEVIYGDYMKSYKDKNYFCNVHSQSYYSLKIKGFGFSPLSNYIDSSTPIKVLCLKCGFINEKTLTDIAKKACSQCFKEKSKYTIEYIRGEFNKIGYKLETKIYNEYRQKLYYFCDKGHYTYIKWNDFQQGCRCSDCANDLRKGESNPRWNPELTDEERLYKRASYEYNLWRMAVFYNDDYTCKCCGDSQGRNLNAHHIENFSKNKESQLDVENGITLCVECHEGFHWEYGYYNNSLSQLTEYVGDFWKATNKEKEGE